MKTIILLASIITGQQLIACEQYELQKRSKNITLDVFPLDPQSIDYQGTRVVEIMSYCEKSLPRCKSPDDEPSTPVIVLNSLEKLVPKKFISLLDAECDLKQAQEFIDTLSISHKNLKALALILSLYPKITTQIIAGKIHGKKSKKKKKIANKHNVNYCE